MAQKHNEEQTNAPMTRLGTMALSGQQRIIRSSAFAAAKFTADNPVMQLGEMGYETDTGMLKVGDGVTAWNDLAYIGGGAGGLPTQTGNAGKFLTTDGTDASWSDKPLVNTATGDNSLSVLGNVATYTNSVNIGKSTNITGFNAVAVGYGASAYKQGTSIGSVAEASGQASVAIGLTAVASANKAIQLGGGTNSDANTFKVGNTNGNFEMMSADGTIPHARLVNAVSSTSVTIATTDWSSNTASVTVSGLTATSVVWVAPDNASQSAYTTAGVYASSQSADTLTFTCTQTPTASLTINVVFC